MKARDKGRLPPFVPLLVETLDSPAWRAMSHGARSLYVALKRRYSSNFKNNGKIYLATRDAAKELGSGLEEIGNWFRELEHYGFIVLTTPGCLGVEGLGKAPHWRLTEMGHMKELPTKDFMCWDGTEFTRRRPRRKQNPDTESRIRVIRKAGSPAIRKAGSVNGTSDTESRIINGGAPDTESRIIASRTTTPSRSEPQRGSEAPDTHRPPWTDPGDVWTCPPFCGGTDPWPAHHPRSGSRTCWSPKRLCCGESTIEVWVKQGTFPTPVKQGGKRLWRWKDVERHLVGGGDLAPCLDDQAAQIREATRAALAKSH